MADLKDTKCSFCGLKSFGRNCPWSPYKKTHYHGDLGGIRCVWCGSGTLYGPNCGFSPSGFHGASSNAFTQMVGEEFYLAHFMNVLETPFDQTQAFKLGLINENGEQLRKPDNDGELAAYSALDKYMFKIKKALGSKTQMLNSEIYLEAAAKHGKQPVINYKSEVQFRDDMAIVVKRFNEAIQEATNAGLPFPSIEKIILESLKNG